MRNEGGKLINNERLEFLGDAILGAVVGDIVYKQFPGKKEGFLTNTRSKIVARETLNKLADETGLIRLIHTNSNTHVSHNSYLGGNAFEALVGAIYLDRGYNACSQFIRKRIIGPHININKLAYKEVNFKSKLLEWSQKNHAEVEFRMVEEAVSTDGSPIFKTQVIIEGIEGDFGEGFSKKESQQKAAKQTLLLLKKNPRFIDAVFEAKKNRMINNESTEVAVF